MPGDSAAADGMVGLGSVVAGLTGGRFQPLLLAGSGQPP